MEEEFNLSKQKTILDGLLSYITQVLRLRNWKQIKKALSEEYYPAKDVKKFIRLLREYEDLKINLTKNNQFMNDTDKEIQINCCIDTKMFISKLSGKELIDVKENNCAPKEKK